MTESSEPQASAPAEPLAPAKRAGPLRRLYNWTIHWAETPQAVWALAVLAVAEASFFPIPPDVLLIAMALGRPRRSLWYATVCTAASVAGGMLGYAIGALFFDAVGRPLVELYGYVDQFNQVSTALGQHGFLYIFIAALTPIPYKVFTIAAGVCHADVSFGALVAASVIGRGLRFFAVGALFRFAGPPIKRFIDRYFNLLTWLFALLLVLGFVCARILAGCQAVPKSPTPAPAAPAPAGEGETAMLSDAARAKLLDVARRTVEAAVRGRAQPSLSIDDPELQGPQGAFVTLRTEGQLRGCIGCFVAEKPLWQVVQEMALSSATRDSRFYGMQLRPEELGRLHIELSVLSPLRRIRDPLSEIELGTHGIYIKRGFRAGCFLPQVATETGWTLQEFLSQCCAGKAGLSPDAWRQPDTEVYVFTAEIIEEPEGGAP